VLFLVIAYDHPGTVGRERRAAARERHLAQAAMNLTARPVYGATILDDAGEMIGSMLVMEAADRDGLDAWLRTEPYVVGQVWDDISVHPCQVPPAFHTPTT
jgi:uncharacterized protein YciI